MKKDMLTQKGLFERLIRLETKLDMIDEKNIKTDSKFTRLAFYVFTMQLLNILLGLMLLVLMT